MSRITERISRMLSMTSKEMTVYVAGDEELGADIRKGWENRHVKDVPVGTSDFEGKGLLIASNNEFLLRF